jgi:hypothetical protein
MVICFNKTCASSNILQIIRAPLGRSSRGTVWNCSLAGQSYCSHDSSHSRSAARLLAATQCASILLVAWTAQIKDKRKDRTEQRQYAKEARAGHAKEKAAREKHALAAVGQWRKVSKAKVITAIVLS